MKVNIRRAALAILLETEAAGKYINLAIASHSYDALSDKERAQLTSLVYTVTERQISYDYIISAISRRESDKIDPYTKNVLRLGIAQIVHMRSIPDFAAVNETVKLARNPGERSFVNGVLRALVRVGDNIPMPERDKNYKRYLSVKYSYPLWIVKHFCALFGESECEKILEHYNSARYTDLTVNTTKISVGDFLSALSENGIHAEENLDTGISVRLDRSVNPERLPGFFEGHFFVQDRASSVSVAALGARAGDTLIDTCSAPGGKSFGSAILMGNVGRVYSMELHESKLSLIENGACRLGLSIIEPRVLDATEPDQALFGMADKVICDAPCSGLGVLGKKADLRYKDKSTLDALPQLQYSILSASVKYLKVGGELVYSTCTLNPSENEKVIERFLCENPGFVPLDFSVGSYSSKGGSLTLLPHVHGCDGFFLSKLKRID
ncbi:MAG: 16S rRNA (cytosine(967)-C(5))-methyltransferase RsmB [Clostridia bacterium]|nr:16S rRNA (cytosine(967)-C(5))-methyltransferase RsmB [Clostridia bacterium]